MEAGKPLDSASYNALYAYASYGAASETDY
jgi:hypothetical protein